MHSCPRCRAATAELVTYTFWGGTLGPRILGLARCRTCSQTFRARSGRTATTGIAIYCIVTLLFTALVAFAVARWFGPPVRRPVKLGGSLHHAQSLDVAGVVAGPILLFLEVPFANAVAADVASAGFHAPELH